MAAYTYCFLLRNKGLLCVTAVGDEMLVSHVVVFNFVHDHHSSFVMNPLF